MMPVLVWATLVTRRVGPATATCSSCQGWCGCDQSRKDTNQQQAPVVAMNCTAEVEAKACHQGTAAETAHGANTDQQYGMH